MIEERAIVLDVQSSTHQPNTASLEIIRKTACGLCGQTRGCGNSIWGKLFAHRSASFKAENLINAQAGDCVIVVIDELALMKTALLVYLVPLLVMLLAAFFASKFTASDVSILMSAFAGLVLGLIWVKGHTTGTDYYQRHQPKILRLADAQRDDGIVHFQ